MPERAVEMVRREGDRYFVRLSVETAVYTSLEGKPDEFLLLTIVGSYDPKLKMLKQKINEKAICRTSTFKDSRGFDHPSVIIPAEIVREYKIEEGEYLELLIEHIVKEDKIAAIYPNLEVLQSYPYWWRKIT
ncbi:TVG1219926 [Thermoplasma volcanium GSS1]|uniref:TVG1219926 protein n=1 Tax=Thermoplasma volcanium (strain ATCC 51530 / DSM 4299 / JCM 9571 / NBRC 15438 / GSS1) TaxID=273116 RepID=Q979H1_THEVO|nr:hypothetical protein [Thermoplasma volcanium]BAB60332.1 TVG1219926 [Thermoplasma volcanium GSS1]